MFRNQIEQKLYKEPNFIGVFARNTLPREIKTRPFALICNTDLIQEPGTHWIAIYCDKNGIGEYFDSYGLPPLYTEFEHFLYRNCPNGYMHNRIPLQCLDCVTCGEYCVAYVIFRLRNRSYADFISLFTSNPNVNDKLIKYYFNKYL